MCYRVWRDGKFELVEEPQEIADSVLKTLTYYLEKMKQYKAEAEKTREEVERDVVGEYQSENEQLCNRIRYTIAEVHSDKELESYNAFCDKHLPCRLKCKINGGAVPYIMQYGTGLGMITKLKCPVCGETTDITDTSVW